MTANKKEALGEISIDQFVELTEKILAALKYSEIKKTSFNAIQAKIDTGTAGSFTTGFMLFNENLSKGYLNLKELAESINKKLISGGYSKIYIISNNSISTGFETELEKKVTIKNSLQFWKIDDILEKIEEYYPDYWRHTDQSLVIYEKTFEEKINESFEIKKLVEYKAAYQKLLSIFIEPNLFLRTQDKQSSKKAYTKISLDNVIDENQKLLLLHGDPGTGKTRLLNEIGKLLIQRNATINGKRYLPIFIDSVNLRDTFNDKDEINLSNLIINDKLKDFFEGKSIDDIIDNYQLIILIDSIDEFEEKYKNKISTELDNLMSKGVKVYLGTRSNSLDDLFKKTNSPDFRDVFIQKFDNEQVQKFTSRYFEGKGNIAESLIQSMRENKILEKLPLTPLNLSLMSILYEETNQEIPATLNDIYDKFSNLLLGRTMVDKSIDFLGITIKENILGMYALELLTRKNSELMTKEEFIIFFKDKFSSNSGTINLEMLPKALDYIIEHTGLLVLHRGKYVKFRHDSYMEYFAAKEIFKNHRNTMETDLVDNFFDVNWQFAAIFYAGITRKMPDFLDKIIIKISKSNTLNQYWSSANGMGYLLQSLYLTDDEIRKKGVREVLKLMVDTYQTFKKISSSFPENVLLGKFPLPVISIFPVILFYDNFDSITLKQPLSLALDELLVEYEKNEKNKDYPYLDNIIYQIMILAITISSSRLGMEDKLTDVIGKIKYSNNEFYTKLLETAIDNLGSNELRKQKKELLHPKKVRRNIKEQNFYIKENLDTYIQPANRHRFGKYDKIFPNKDVKIFVEGPSDAKLIEHAFFILTGHMPYWEIRVGDPTGGGANSLAKTLNEGLAYLNNEQMVIGIFDNDSTGQKEFFGTLHSTKFDLIPNYTRIKKRKEGNIYGMLLPVPKEMQHYIQPNQNDNYFSIEHYLPNSFLNEFNMLKATAIPDIFRINDGGIGKNAFATKVIHEKNVALFKGFIILFKEIDRLCGYKEEIYYKE